MAEYDLAGDLAAGIVAPTSFGVVEGIHAIDYRPDLMLLHQAAQVLQVTTAARRDRLKSRLAHEHGPEVHAAFAGRPGAHQRDLAAIGHGFDRLRQRTGSSDLYHSIHAATGRERAYLIAPSRQIANVDHLAGAQLAEAGGVFWICRRRDHAGAERLGQWKRKQRTPACTLGKDCVAGPHAR